MEQKVDCILCGKEKHLYLNREKGLYHCKKCGRGGKISSITYLLPEYKLKVSSHPISPKIDRNLLQPLKEGSSIYWRYAVNRNATDFKNNLFLYPPCPGYLFIGLPLLESFDDQYFFFGRKVALSGPRYRYFQPTKGIIAKSFKGITHTALVCEGIFDLFNVAEFFPTIALLGKQSDDEKIMSIRNSVSSKVIICLDSDALQESVILEGKLAKEGLKTKIIHSSIVKDPADDNEWILKIIGGR